MVCDKVDQRKEEKGMVPSLTTVVATSTFNFIGNTLLYYFVYIYVGGRLRSCCELDQTIIVLYEKITCCGHK